MIPVLFVNPFAYMGGGEISLLTILSCLDRRQWKPYVICFANGAFVDEVRALGVEAFVFPRSGFLSNFSIIFHLCSFIRKRSIKLVHVNCLDIRAAVASIVAGVPYIGHLRVIFPLSMRDRWFVKHSRLTITVSDAVQRTFCQTHSGCEINLSKSRIQ